MASVPAPGPPGPPGARDGSRPTTPMPSPSPQDEPRDGRDGPAPATAGRGGGPRPPRVDPEVARQRRAMLAGAPPELSLVIPVFDEEENLPRLHAEIERHVGAMGRTFEVVYVDDRSRDDSLRVLRELHAADPHVRVVRFRRNFGQTPAMSAGFEHSRGRIVITLDADLQNDPADIPALVAKLEEGYDIVVGWRKNRQDGLVLRKVPSRIANRIIARITGSTVHDTGCTLKAFRRELIENLPIYAEQHRFLPVLSLASGARIAEIVVNHRPRIFGVSKYGIGRAVRVALDLLTMKLLSSFARSPLAYFVIFGAPFVLLPLIYLAVAAAQPEPVSFENRWGYAVIVTLSVSVMTGIYFALLGLLAELVVKLSRRNDRPLSTRHRTAIGGAA